MEQALQASERPDVWLQDMADTVMSKGRPHQDNLSAFAVWVSANHTVN
jgi:hypothetical protein